MTGRWLHIALGGLVSLALVLAAAALSAWPSWQSLPAGHGVIRLSFTHSGARTCRDRSQAELDALPRNMRQAQICERRRPPVHVEMDVDGGTVLARSLPPTGLSGTGPSRVYQNFELPAGTYDIALRLRDDPALVGYGDAAEFRVDLAPGQSVAIDYDPGSGGFFIH